LMPKLPITILMEVLNLSLTESYHFNNPTDEQSKILALVEWGLKHRVPVSRIINRRFFWKDEFVISPFVLDPRSETTELVKYAQTNLKPQSILDLGTGTGCILLSLMREFPDAYGLGVDISQYAIENAKLNSTRLGIKADFTVMDLGVVTGKFDLIVSNPPYVRTSCEFEALFDPPISLYDTGCYERLVQKRNLNKGGAILLEVPAYSGSVIEELAYANQLAVHKEYISEQIMIYCLQD